MEIALSIFGELVPDISTKLASTFVVEDCHWIAPVKPVRVIVGNDPGTVPKQIVDVPAEIFAVPATVAGDTLTVALIVADGHTPLVTTAK